MRQLFTLRVKILVITTILSAFYLALAPMYVLAVGQNLLNNGSFDTSSSWQTSGSVIIGNGVAQFYSPKSFTPQYLIESTGKISQTIQTIPGAHYKITYNIRAKGGKTTTKDIFSNVKLLLMISDRDNPQIVRDLHHEALIKNQEINKLFYNTFIAESNSTKIEFTGETLMALQWSGDIFPGDQEVVLNIDEVVIVKISDPQPVAVFVDQSDSLNNPVPIEPPGEDDVVRCVFKDNSVYWITSSECSSNRYSISHTYEYDGLGNRINESTFEIGPPKTKITPSNDSTVSESPRTESIVDNTEVEVVENISPQKVAKKQNFFLRIKTWFMRFFSK